jgi:hypothetical protein
MYSFCIGFFPLFFFWFRHSHCKRTYALPSSGQIAASVSKTGFVTFIALLFYVPSLIGWERFSLFGSVSFINSVNLFLLTVALGLFACLNYGIFDHSPVEAAVSIMLFIGLTFWCLDVILWFTDVCWTSPVLSLELPFFRSIRPTKWKTLGNSRVVFLKPLFQPVIFSLTIRMVLEKLDESSSVFDCSDISRGLVFLFNIIQFKKERQPLS